MKKIKKQILFISATHGDEGFSIPILDKLERMLPKRVFGYDRIIGNPKALALNKRQAEANLNRSAPGNPKSRIYEERRAFKIMQFAKEYSCVIDLHGADSACGIVIIMCNPTWSNFILAGMLDVKRVVIWRTNEDLTKGPLTQFCQMGLEIECGPKTERKIQQRLGKVLEQFIKNYQALQAREIMRNLKSKEIFQIYDKLAGEDKRLVDFKPVKRKGEQFYPFMSNLYPGTACYKMKRIKLAKLFLLQSLV